MHCKEVDTKFPLLVTKKEGVGARSMDWRKQWFERVEFRDTKGLELKYN